MERLLVTQALDERDLLVKKINDKIRNLQIVDIIKANEDYVCNKRIPREEFEQQAKSSLQQIEDLIARHQRIDTAIVASNASTKIETEYGSFTVAGAIALRNRLRGGVTNGKARNAETGRELNEMDFEGSLYKHMNMCYTMMLEEVESRNRKLQTTAETMHLSILGKDSKGKDAQPLAVVEAYVKENTTELVDPLEVQKKMETMKEKREALLAELETRIKVSNATTFIEF